MMTRACVQTASRPTRAPPSCPFHVLFHVHLRDLDRLVGFPVPFHASFHVRPLRLCHLTPLSCQLSCPFHPTSQTASTPFPDGFMFCLLESECRTSPVMGRPRTRPSLHRQ